jgi:flavin-binding protein dodecin
MGGVYKLLKLVGTSETGFEDAVRNAVSEASKTIRNISWFEVVEQRGMVRNGQVGEFQVIINVGFRIEGVEQA